MSTSTRFGDLFLLHDADALLADAELADAGGDFDPEPTPNFCSPCWTEFLADQPLSDLAVGETLCDQDGDFVLRS